jgi:hypothetical protein
MREGWLMIIKKKQPIVAEIPKPIEVPQEPKQDPAKTISDQITQLNDTIAKAASALAMTIAKNKPAESYRFSIQRDERGQITSMIAKRGHSA